MGANGLSVKDDWDSFMQGMNMDAGPSSAWPILPGLATNMPTPNFAAPGYQGSGGGGVGVNGDGGGQQQQSPGGSAVSPSTIPGMGGLYQPLGAEEKLMK